MIVMDTGVNLAPIVSLPGNSKEKVGKEIMLGNPIQDSQSEIPLRESRMRFPL